MEAQKIKVLASLRLIKVAIITTSQGVPFEVNCEVNTDALPKFLTKNHYQIFFVKNHYKYCHNFGLKIIKITTKSYLDKNHYLIFPQSLKITMILGPLVGPLGSNLGVL